MNNDFARRKMVEQQIRTWDVSSPQVLKVLGEVRREQYVPFGYESLAFADTAIPIGHAQHMMTPSLEGRTLQALELGGGEHVLEIGSGRGFLTACLAKLAAGVTSLEIHEDLHKCARENIADAGIENVELLVMDATRQLPDGTFDAIAITGSLQTFDPRYVDKLKTGGRLFVIVGDAPAMDARIIHKMSDTDWESESLFETVIAPLENGASPRPFLF